jgi:hypothetical protein
MTIEGTIKEAGELKEFELMQDVLWIAVYRFSKDSGMWTSTSYHEKDKLLEFLRNSSFGTRYDVRIYKINL